MTKLLIEEAKKAVRKFSADVVVLGCGGMMGLHMKIQRVLKTPVIDPFLVTVKMAEVVSYLGLIHSKAWIYNIPKHKMGNYAC